MTSPRRRGARDRLLDRQTVYGLERRTVGSTVHCWHACTRQVPFTDQSNESSHSHLQQFRLDLSFVPLYEYKVHISLHTLVTQPLPPKHIIISARRIDIVRVVYCMPLLAHKNYDDIDPISSNVANCCQSTTRYESVTKKKKERIQ